MEHPGGSGVRFDTHIYGGYTISPYYDSLLGKLVVHAPTRQEAIKAMRLALDECVIRGIETTIPLHQRLLAESAFIDGDYDIHWLERWLEDTRDG